MPDSVVTPTIIIGGSDTGVPNTVFADGSTMPDLITQAQTGARNNGEATSSITQLANGWRDAGLITGRQKGAITAALG